MFLHFWNVWSYIVKFLSIIYIYVLMVSIYVCRKKLYHHMMMSTWKQWEFHLELSTVAYQKVCNFDPCIVSLRPSSSQAIDEVYMNIFEFLYMAIAEEKTIVRGLRSKYRGRSSSQTVAEHWHVIRMCQVEHIFCHCCTSTRRRHLFRYRALSTH